MCTYKEKLKNISTFVFDYDGVLTNGTIILQPDGEALRTANVKDGYSLQLAVKKGYNVVVISGGVSKSMANRFKALKVKDFFLGVEEKSTVLKKYLKDNNIDPENVLYMGDDIPDHKPMTEVGLPCCPVDAVPEIKSIALYISDKKGGDGCVRDVIEQTLKMQNHWMTDEGFKW